jgi:hypothetical protein
MEGEDPAEYQRSLEAFLDEYQPATPTEEALTVEITDNHWRLQRAKRIEAELSLDGLTSPNRNPDYFTKLGRYVTRVRRDLQETITQLRQIQAGRLKAEKAEVRDSAPERKSSSTQLSTASTTSSKIGFVSQSASGQPPEPVTPPVQTPPTTGSPRGV